MRKLVKLALVAGAAGAVAGGVQAFRQDETGEVIAQKALKGAGEAAALGAVIGFVLDRRDKRRLAKMAKARAGFGAALTTGGIVEAARAARPALEHARGVVSQAAAQAAESARPKVGHAVDVARPKVEAAARVARERAIEAAELARERAIEAAEAARPRVEHAVDVARPKVEAAARAARERALEAAEAARPLVTRDRGVDGLDGARPILVRVA